MINRFTQISSLLVGKLSVFWNKFTLYYWNYVESGVKLWY